MQRNRLLPLSFLVLVFLAAVILYWPTIHLPLIYDDLLHIRIAKGLDFESVWLPTEAFGFYRPLTFFPLLVIREIFGRYPAELLHGINIFQHALNGALLVLLSWRMWHRVHWAAASGLLLILFPFSYQAIAVYGHNVHPATAGIILAALNTYLAAMKSSRHAVFWWLVTLILFMAGLLSHESAILFGLFAALVHWNQERKLTEIDPKDPASSVINVLRQPWFLFLISGALFAIAYQFLDLSRAPQASYSGGSLWNKLLYLGQGAAYPITWFGGWLPGEDAVVRGLVLVGVAVMIALTLWSARERSNRLPLLMGWGWWLAASVLIAVPLEASYLLHGPRLFYLGGVGLSLLWPVLLEPVLRIERGGRVMWASSLILVLVSNWIYVRNRLADYAQLTSPVAVVKETMRDKPTDQGITLVNLPQWIDRRENPFRVGVDLVAMMGDYLFAEELIAENLGEERPVKAIVVPDLLDAPGYNYGLHNQSPAEELVGSWAPGGSQVFVVSYLEEGPSTSYTGMVSVDSEDDLPLLTIGPYILLEASAESCEGAVRLDSEWRLNSEYEATLSPTTSIFVQLLDDSGQLLNQADGPLLGLRPDLLGLAPGWAVKDHRSMESKGIDSGEVLVGVYDFSSGERYPAWDRSGSRLEEDSLSVPLQFCP